MEVFHTLAEAEAKRAAAHDRWQKTGDLDALIAATAGTSEIFQRLAPSKLDLWEARQRLIELIHDSDDDTVFDLYLIAKSREREGAKLDKELEDLLAQIEQNRHNRESRDVTLTPEN